MNDNGPTIGHIDEIRQCECGCGLTFRAKYKACRFHPTCALRRKIESRKRWKKEHPSIGRNRARKDRAYSKPKPDAEPQRTPELKCRACGSMPHAREAGRLWEDDCGRKLPVLGENGRCCLCNGVYAPLPELRIVAKIGSSGATCARHGEYYGHVINSVPRQKLGNKRRQA